MLQKPCNTLGFKKKNGQQNSPWGGGGKPNPASGLLCTKLKSCKLFNFAALLNAWMTITVFVYLLNDT